MKKIWVFIVGVITGIVLTVLSVMAVQALFAGNADTLAVSEKKSERNMMLNAESASRSSLKIFQVLEPTAALAMLKDDFSSGAYLLVNNEGKSYYDDQVIKLPTGKCFKQIGTYQYPTKDDRLKTVPVVQIL